MNEINKAEGTPVDSGESNTYQTNNANPPKEEAFDNMASLGVAGVRMSSGFVQEEFLASLTGAAGRQVYRQMRDNDDTIGAFFFILEGIIRAVPWVIDFEEGDDGEGAAAGEGIAEEITYRNIDNPEVAIAFLEGVLFDDMATTWDEALMSVLTQYVFGWQYSEIIWKKRNGLQKDISKISSVFNDGLLGVHRLADRSQETLYKWDVRSGEVYGMWQQDPNGGEQLYIPIQKAVHFTTSSNKGNPEGRSILRNAYRPWFFKKNLQEQEAMGIERNLNGLPVISIPNATLIGTDTASVTAKRLYEAAVRDVKNNEQGGLVLPSDPWFDGEGNPTNLKQVSIELLSAGTSTAIDADKVIQRYDTAIARSVAAQFLMMSTKGSTGGYSQSKNETDLFFRAVEGMVNDIASTLNRQLVTKIWEVNGLDPVIMPFLKPGRLNPVDLEQLGKYVKDLAGSGFTLFDADTEEYLRQSGGLPPMPEGGDELIVFDNGEEEPPPEPKPAEGEGE